MSYDKSQNAVHSFRDWGRDYKCVECKRDCKKRFENGQDCRYAYAHFGYNCEITEMQAVLLREQIQKIESFTIKRQQNWDLLYSRLNKYNKYFSIQEPTPYSNPSWFSFLMTIRDSRIQRKDFQQYLEDNGIETRILFAGNILDHKCMKDLEEFWDYRVIGTLENSKYIKDNSFFIGCYPGITVEDTNYIAATIDKFLSSFTNK